MRRSPILALTALATTGRSATGGRCLMAPKPPYSGPENVLGPLYTSFERQ